MTKGPNRVNRGGSWNNNASNCRSANRNRNTPDNRNNNLGFRVAVAHPPAMEIPVNDPVIFRFSISLVIQSRVIESLVTKENEAPSIAARCQ
jgi:hypothetical protein